MENKHPINDGKTPQAIIDFFLKKKITAWEEVQCFLVSLNDGRAYLRANFSEVYTDLILKRLAEFVLKTNPS